MTPAEADPFDDAMVAAVAALAELEARLGKRARVSGRLMSRKSFGFGWVAHYSGRRSDR